MRVLFISDVYFPRVNGVSTSIRTFREDLARCRVETLLVARCYGPLDARRTRARGTGDETVPHGAERPSSAGESGLLCVPARPVPGDPEDRRMSWRALTRELDGLAPDSLDLVPLP